MPRYSPLPSVNLDSILEPELREAAARKIIEASNGNLNDFSPGNPLSALLEGQIFAASEFLFWANQLPEKILETWIGPFWGGMRRLGTPSVALLKVEVPPRDSPLTIPSGSEFRTNPEMSLGETITFVSTEDSTINPGELVFHIPVSSKYVGSKYNLPENSITVSSSSVLPAGTRITNPQPAAGGSDVEDLSEAHERILSLMRRRNPVSEYDWQEFFIDMFGLGTITVVRPNQSSFGGYSHNHDFANRNSRSISLFVLGPEGERLTDEQINRGQRIVNFSAPVNTSAFLYPISLDEVRIDITLELSRGGILSQDTKNTSLSIRDRLRNILSPGVIFPVGSPPTLGDIESALNATVPAEYRYKDPKILKLAAYNTPVGLSKERVLFSKVKDFEDSPYLLMSKDLIRDSNPNTVFYPVLESFSPESAGKFDQCELGRIKLTKIRQLSPGEFKRGDIVYCDNCGEPGIRIILEGVNIRSLSEVPSQISEGRISPIQSPILWLPGTEYTVTKSGKYLPDIVEYDWRDGEFLPDEDSPIPLSTRPGGLIWVVQESFVLPQPTNSLTGAKEEFKLGSSVIPDKLVEGKTYPLGTWIYTPVVGGGEKTADPLYYYVDPLVGVVSKYAYVNEEFIFEPNETPLKEAFDRYVEDGIISEVSVIDGKGGLPVNRYRARFRVGEYLEYIDMETGVHKFFIVSAPFSPAEDLSYMVSQGLLIPVAVGTKEQKRLLGGVSIGLINKPRKMFTFFKGEQTMFRRGSDAIVFVAQEDVTPLADFEVYRENGVFSPLSGHPNWDSVYVSYFNREQPPLEDIIISPHGRSLYRVVQPFTPSEGQTLEDLELQGKIKRIVRKFSCSEPLIQEVGNISTMRLGQVSVTVTGPGGKENFLWGDQKTATIRPALLSKGGNLPRSCDYGGGTFAP